MGPSSAVGPPPRRRRGKGRLAGGRASHGLRGFWAFVKALQKQQQLRRVELLAALAKEPPGQRIKLLPQQLDLLQRPVALPQHTGELPGEFGELGLVGS